MPDLFDQKPYPASPGYTEPTTSRDAAAKVAPRVKNLRYQVLAVYRSSWPGGLTADEVADRLGKSILSIRPRVTELRRTGDLMPCLDVDCKPTTRKNASGVGAAVLVCRRPV